MCIQKLVRAWPDATLTEFSGRNPRARPPKTGHLLKHFVCVVFAAVYFIGVGQASAVSMYADWTLISGTDGTGTFDGVAGMPDFTFTLTEDVTPSDTEIDDDDIFDNTVWEALFGEGDNQESLRFGSPGQDGSDNGLLTNSTLTLTFDAPVDPLGTWAFAVTDLEREDAVISASLGGVPVPDKTVASWFRQLFDSQPATDGSPHLPSGFDAANVAVVAEVDTDGLLSDENFGDLSPGGTESASVWFIPSTPIDALTITHRNRFGGRSSMHVYAVVRPDPSLQFDGQNDHVDLNRLDVPGSALTLEARFNGADLNGCVGIGCEGRLISKARSASARDHYWMISTDERDGDNRLRFRLRTNGATTTLTANSGNLVDDTSYHVTATYDGSRMRLYLDGNLVGSTSKSGSVGTNPSVDAFVGDNPGRTRRAWNGRIDDVRIWNVARSQAEIQANKDIGLTGAEPGLVAYYPFDEGAGQTTDDASPNNNTAILGNSPSPDSADPIWR